MKNVIIALIVVSAIGILLAVKFNGDNQAANVVNQTKESGGQLIDVREASEYNEGHADNAINIPLDDILNGDYSKLDKNKAIYVYCKSGVRAGKAKDALEKAGFKNVKSIGGLNDWQSDGGAVCKTEKQSC